MPVAFVQGAFARGANVTSLAPALTGVTSGNTLVLAVAVYNATEVLPTSVSDGANTYTLRRSVIYAGSQAAIYTASNVTGGNRTCTVTWTPNSWGTAHLSEWSGVDNSDPVGVGSTNSGETNAPLISSTGPFAANGAAYAVAAANILGQSNISIDVPPGYTNLHQEQNAATYLGGSFDYKLIASSGNEAPSWATLVAVADWATAIIELKGTAPPWVRDNPDPEPGLWLRDPFGQIFNGEARRRLAQVEAWMDAADGSDLDRIFLADLFPSGAAQDVTGAGGIASTVALGTPTVAQPAGDQPITGAGGVASTAALGTPTVAPGAVGISPGGIASTAALGTPTVGRGAVGLSPGGVASTAAVGTPTVAPGARDLFPGGVASTAALGTPAVAAGAVGISPGGIASTAALGTPTVTQPSGDAITGAGGIASTAALGTATVGRGAVGISPGGIASAAALGTPAVGRGAVDIAPIGVASTAALGTPVVAAGEVDVAPGGVASTAAVGVPVVSGGGAVALAVLGIPSTATIGIPTIAGGASGDIFGVGGAQTESPVRYIGVFEPPDVRRRTG
jgi:hypothetical protein